MTEELSQLRHASPNIFDAPGFFHSNLQIQEALSTVRYGIEARKGLIVLTGEAGVGKTTLLHKVSHDLAANVTWMIESDPRLSFVDVVRLMVRNLEVENSGSDEAVMLRACKLHLRERLENCEIVALLIDNAHDLPDQTLRLISQHFLGASAEDPDGTLLQLVLAGRPELKLKLAEAALVPLRRKPPIFCELHPVGSRDICSYVHHWLRARHQPAELFDARAMKRVALYTRGNLRDVNLLCERASQLADSVNGTIVSAEAIDRAANDLDLRELQSFKEPLREQHFRKPERSIKPTARSQRFAERDPIEHAAEFQFFPGEYRESASRSFPPDLEPPLHSAPTRKKRGTAWVQVVTVLIILITAAAMVRIDSAFEILAGWNSALEQLSARPPEQLSAKLNEQPETPQPRTVNKDPLVPLPGPDRPTLVDNEQPSGIPTAPPSDHSSAELSVDRNAKPLPEHRITSAPKNRLTSRTDHGSQPDDRGAAPVGGNGNAMSENLQMQVTRAIENRAIMGVEVSVVHGTAYLDGHVATERQRRAAERAARSVNGVQRVHNRIAITYG